MQLQTTLATANDFSNINNGQKEALHICTVVPRCAVHSVLSTHRSHHLAVTLDALITCQKPCAHRSAFSVFQRYNKMAMRYTQLEETCLQPQNVFAPSYDMPAAHDIYAEQLRELRRGHPLHHPEPRPKGPVEIGDVGYTKDGAFRRLFNASRPANDPIQCFGIPDDFVQLDMGVIDTFDAVLEPGPLHSRTISTLSTEVGTPGCVLQKHRIS